MTTSITTRPYWQHLRALFLLGLPIIIAQIGSIVQGLADTIMVGQYSAEALASAGFVNNIITTVLVFALGYSYAITPIVGPHYARGEYKEVGRALRTGIIMNGRVGIILFLLMGLLYFFLDRMGQPEELLPLIRPYYITVLISIPFQTLFNAFKQFYDGIGNTKLPMWTMLASNALNILGNWLLIYGVGPFPEWGLLGAGIATLASRIIMLAVVYWVFLFHDDYKIYRESYRVRSPHFKEDCRQLNRLGWPLALQMGMETASFSLCIVMQGWFGTSALAAHQIMTQIGALCFMVYYGIGAAVAIRVSHFNGLKDTVNVWRSALTGYGMILCTGILISIAIALNIELIAGWFTDDKTIHALLFSIIPPFVLYQFGDGLQINFGNALRGIADVKPLMRYAFISYILISLPLSYVFGFICQGGPAGIWMSYPVALTTAGSLFFRRFRKKTRRPLVS